MFDFDCGLALPGTITWCLRVSYSVVNKKHTDFHECYTIQILLKLVLALTNLVLAPIHICYSKKISTTEMQREYVEMK